MTAKNNELTFVKYRLTWKFTDDGEDQESFFYLPFGIEPSEYVGSILSVVELSASEYGYEYELVIVECPNFIKDEIYYENVKSGEVTDKDYVERIDAGKQSCKDCLWVEGNDECLYDECNAKDPQDLTREELDRKWAELQQRIKDSDGPIKVTGLIGKLNSDDQLKRESLQESEALGDA